jgi:4-hydroxybenzoate polyprenyltransferase
MIFARNAAMAFNRYIDREYDSKNPRTGNREIPAGKITHRSALIFTIANALLFCITTLFINRLSFVLSFPALTVILGYSYTKRFTSLCHFILGLGLAIAPTGAYIALTGTFSTPVVLLSAMVMFWVSGFDILYSLSDSDFDQKNGLHSIPVAIGVGNAAKLSATVHFLAIILALFIGLKFNRGAFYLTGSIVFSILLIYWHLTKTPDRRASSFGAINGMASICYGVFSIADLIVC